jgi:dihydrofolate synthase/folylpolyglutamate synthase
METVLPGVILDGAHNDSGVEEFVKTARRIQKDQKVTVLFSCVKEKDYEGMIRTICEQICFDSVVVTQIDSDRQVPASELAAIFRRYTEQPVVEISSIPEAFDEALSRKGDGILFCVGSLYLVGSLKSLLRSRENA